MTRVEVRIRIDGIEAIRQRMVMVTLALLLWARAAGGYPVRPLPE